MKLESCVSSKWWQTFFTTKDSFEQSNIGIFTLSLYFYLAYLIPHPHADDEYRACVRAHARFADVHAHGSDLPYPYRCAHGIDHHGDGYVHVLPAYEYGNEHVPRLPTN